MELEELLKPRYKVITDYPGCQFEVGQIIEFTTKEIWFTGKLDWVSAITKMKGGQTQFSIKMIEPYEKVFKKLQWWEERDLEDMPEYITMAIDVTNKGECFKVSEWYFYITPVGGEESIGFRDYYGYTIGVHAVEPISKEEFETYIKHKDPK